MKLFFFLLAVVPFVVVPACCCALDRWLIHREQKAAAAEALNALKKGPQ